ncbi:MAG: phage holin family protein [Peptococcaceae bacterium]|nr:phage holin family protein [Peptococcaceae bacterium]
MLTGFFTPGLSIHGFGTAFLTSLIVTVCNWVTRDAYRKKDHF